MKKSTTEFIVGLFIFIGLLCMAYTSIKLGKVDFFYNDYYPLTASFTSSSGLKTDTNIDISGVTVGKVTEIKLTEEYQAEVSMLIRNGVKIQDDAIASIRTNGILGEKYIEIIPGGSDIILEPGEFIFDTEPPFDLMTVIKNFAVSGGPQKESDTEGSL